ncbi:MAG: MoaD/ThiS family protein [Chloroflexota bacterium]
MKTISVRVNGSLVEMLGASRLTLQLPQQATVADLVQELSRRHPQTTDLLARAVAVAGGKHIEPSTVLTDNQEVALLLPIAGG